MAWSESDQENPVAHTGKDRPSAAADMAYLVGAWNESPALAADVKQLTIERDQARAEVNAIFREAADDERRRMQAEDRIRTLEADLKEHLDGQREAQGSLVALWSLCRPLAIHDPCVADLAQALGLLEARDPVAESERCGDGKESKP